MPVNAKEAANVKVVHLEPESQRLARARIARLPAAIHAIHEKGKHLLLDKLKVFFDRADDSLFELADKAASNQEQNIYFDSMREVRVQRRGFEKRFAMAVDSAFACLATGEIQDKTAIYEEALDTDALSLVHNEELEELVAIESSLNRANAEYGELLQLISLRLDSLVQVKVFHKNNPLGPEVLANAFMDQAKRLDIDIKAKLVLFKLFDKTVMQDLGVLYEATNQILLDHNVLPSLSRTQKKESTGSTGASTAEQSAPVTAGKDDVVSLLKGLLAEQQLMAAQNSAVAEVVRLLSLAQKAPLPVGSFRGGMNALHLIEELQGRSGSHASIARTEQEVIKLVDMLFNFILEDRNLADPMKELISRLQIPIVKVALLDKSFFSKGGHAARRLLNEMATAALGWQPGEAGGKDDVLYQKIGALVGQLLTEFDTDVSIFNELLADFTSFVEKDRRRAQILERRTLDAEDGKAKAEVARTLVAIEVELRTLDQELPEVAKRLVFGPWNNVLFVTNLKTGSQSAEWQTALQTLDDLIWSTRIPRSGEDRKRLIRLIPDLLQRLRVGLDSISFNPFEMSEIFKQLEEVHLAAIRGGVDGGPAADNPQASVAAAREAAPAASEPRISDASEGARSAPSSDALARKQTNTATATTKSSNDSAMADFEDDLDAIDLSASDLLADVDAVLASSGANGEADAPKPAEPPAPAVPPSAPQAPAAASASASDAGESDPYLQQVANFVKGAWFELTDEAGEMSRCRLAAHIKPTGKYIFVNRSGMKVAEKTQEDLAELLKQNRIRALDNSMLFDRALETVVSSLRKPPR